jgi:hypothetical protein
MQVLAFKSLRNDFVQCTNFFIFEQHFIHKLIIKGENKWLLEKAVPSGMEIL